MARTIDSVLVAGHGVMGRGIVRSFARGGHKVTVLSRDPSKLQDLPDGVAAVSELPAAAPDLVLETIVERMDAKLDLYARLQAAYGAGDDAPIIASNTSSLSLDALSDGLENPARFIGIHYFQPADAFPLVEVIRTEATGDDTVAAVAAALKRNGQDMIRVNKPVVGFVINRLQHALLNEAYWLIEQGVTSAEDVDSFARRMFGPRMCITGLIKQKDISGLDTNALAMQETVPSLNHTGKVAPVLLNKARDGDYGVKSGRGFYDWDGVDVPSYKRETEAKLQALLGWLEEN